MLTFAVGVIPSFPCPSFHWWVNVYALVSQKINISLLSFNLLILTKENSSFTHLHKQHARLGVIP